MTEEEFWGRKAMEAKKAEETKAAIIAKGGVKYDGDKNRFDLIPAYPLQEIARVYTIGAKKYADRNWEKGMAWGRIFSAMMRHAWAWWGGEKYDPKDGQHHLASVAWCAMALMEYEHRKTGEDDRPYSTRASTITMDEWIGHGLPASLEEERDKWLASRGTTIDYHTKGNVP